MLLKITKAKKSMQVLEELKNLYAPYKKLEGLVIGACLHVTKETGVLLLALQDCGANVYVCGSNPLSTDDQVVSELRAEGVVVYAKRGESQDEYFNAIEKVAQKRPHIVIDDGADLITFLHDNPKYAHRVMWAQEETTTGVERVRALEKTKGLNFPVFLVNDFDTKRLFDNYYGTGQSTIDGIIRATGVMIAGKTFVVAGYGNCGKGLAQRARGMGANVIVTEVDSIKALQAVMDGFRVMKMIDAAPIGDIFVTVTGNRDVIVREHMEKMKSNAILANSGHFDVEIDVKVAKELGLNILAEGRLVNLVCADGHPSDVMDLSFSNQFLVCLSTLDIYQSLENKCQVVNKEIDNQVARWKLSSLEITIDKLSDEQKKYLGII